MKKPNILFSVIAAALLLSINVFAKTINNIGTGAQSAPVFTGTPAEVTFLITLNKARTESEVEVPLTVEGLPSGVTSAFVTDVYPYPVSFAPDATTAYATLKLSVDNTVPAGTYQISVNGEGFSSGTVNLLIDTSPASPVLKSQTINFRTIASPQIIKESYRLNATTDSGLEISYTASGACFIDASNSSKLNFDSIGDCTIIAKQSGNSEYLPAKDAEQKISVEAMKKKTQIITFNSIGDFYILGQSVTLTAVSDSGLPITFSTEGSCSMDLDNLLQLNFETTGHCKVTASQEGDENFGAAESISQSIQIEDNDGVDKEAEDSGPNAGDGNGNDIRDSEEVNVVSAPDYNLDGEYVTLEVTGNISQTSITNFQTNSTKGIKISDGSSAPVGGFSFIASGGFEGTLQVRIILDKVYDTTNWTLKKTLGDSGNLTDGPSVTFRNVKIGNVEKTQIEYSIRDNEEFDEDKTDGLIKDPIFVISTPVPVITPTIASPVFSGSIVSPSASYSYRTRNIFDLNQGQVLGASTTIYEECWNYMDPDTVIIPKGKNNNKEQVKLLQKFLNKNLGIHLPVTGYYGNLTQNAVKVFQVKYTNRILVPWGISEPTLNTYYTTVHQINMLSCPAHTGSIEINKLVPLSERN